jgi:hypothetical protein
VPHSGHRPVLSKGDGSASPHWGHFSSGSAMLRFLSRHGWGNCGKATSDIPELLPVLRRQPLRTATSRSRTLASHRSRCRRQQVEPEGYGRGRSRHRQPERNTYTTPTKQGRSPSGLGLLGGTSGSARAHTASSNSRSATAVGRYHPQRNGITSRRVLQPAEASRGTRLIGQPQRRELAMSDLTFPCPGCGKAVRCVMTRIWSAARLAISPRGESVLCLNIPGGSVGPDGQSASARRC